MSSLIQKLKDNDILPENYIFSKPSFAAISGGHHKFDVSFDDYFDYVNKMATLGNGYAASEDDEQTWNGLYHYIWYRYYPEQLILVKTQHYGAVSPSARWTKKLGCVGYIPQSQLGYVLILLNYNAFPFRYRRELDPMIDRLLTLVNGHVDPSEMGKSLYEFVPEILQLHPPGMFGSILNVSIEELKLGWDMTRLALQ